MYIQDGSFFKIYFGDKQDKIFKEYFINLSKINNISQKNIYDMLQFSNLKKNIGLDNLIFLDQVHGINGHIFTSEQQLDSIEIFKTNGDFLVTNIKNLAIGVLTADCLPIIFVDYFQKAVGVAHAGWRGSVDGIAVKTIKSMQDLLFESSLGVSTHIASKFGSNLDNIKIFFGPCIKSCCYKVSENFVENLSSFNFASEVFYKRLDGLYFDLPKFNVLLLEEFGVKRENIIFDYNYCTYCDNTFFSYRRGDSDGRQMSVVCLK